MTPKTRRRIFALVPVLALVALAEIGARVALSDAVRGRVLDRLFRDADPNPDARIVHESFLQLRIAPQLVADPYAGYRHRDPVDPASRRPPFLPAPPKTPGETRVVCVGDSVTFGNSFDDSWPGRLQHRLDAAAPGRFVVFNAGTPGHNVVQCKRLLQSRWIELAPDVVVWLEKSHFADRVELPAPIAPARMTALEQLYRFRALYLVTAAAQAWSARRADPVARAFDSSLAPAPGARPNVLPDLARWCGVRGVRAFIALAYLEHDGDEIRTLEGDFDETARATYDTAPARLVFASPLAAFRAHPGGATALFTDRIHLTGEGAALVAGTVADTVLATVGEAP